MVVKLFVPTIAIEWGYSIVEVYYMRQKRQWDDIYNGVENAAEQKPISYIMEYLSHK